MTDEKQVNFLGRYECPFSAYFINMNLLKAFAHSHKFTTYVSGTGRKKHFDARFKAKKCKNSNIGHFTVPKIFSLMKAYNCNKNTTFHKAK